MTTLLEGAVPPPHLRLATASTWPNFSTNTPAANHCLPTTSSPAPMTPDSIRSYVPHLHDSPHLHPPAPPPLPLAPDAGPVPSTGWYAPSLPADAHQSSYSYGYDQYPLPSQPQPSSHSYPAPQHLSGPPTVSAAPVSVEHPAGNFSPVSDCSRTSHARADHVLPSQYHQQSQAPSPEAAPAAGHLAVDVTPSRPRSSPTEYHWPMGSLGISNPSMQPFYPPSFPQARDRSPCVSEPALDISAPQARRFYAPIAPHPSGARTSAPKRARDDDEDPAEHGKKRKRSDSQASATVELGEEDRLLIQLKDEESMPWKDIAARFQSDLGKTYQIPALQMRLKRLRERMRVWTDVDVKALRMAHDYWVQSKFDIIAQKMLEYGAAEKWTARQCARKWAEIDPGPTPYTTYEHHVYTPYAMSPVEPHHFMPYVHIQ